MNRVTENTNSGSQHIGVNLSQGFVLYDFLVFFKALLTLMTPGDSFSYGVFKTAERFRSITTALSSRSPLTRRLSACLGALIVTERHGLSPILRRANGLSCSKLKAWKARCNSVKPLARRLPSGAIL